ncbi:murein hydrolase activator EnvC family protein [Flavobacterium aquatile]|uniref:Peptidase M23 n=1 Tax=Flavobacterium aquatile LMG 4008 = ATCC 11947 TaxID=1453498 RepID=A0A095SW42_9FLAO|nr:peptidoglycan DD-metalloendopeptidase family protein [Flavobacterium aquatile]KGD68817.1 peptidase M23 [Flavobacterium aquatile LMG 4008 = ATCC 11947]OXA69236.1 peptidase M23 [Flavobacterium aquatile] [Flavobacterium aquatile LMG 4008 = ATCC 11947]GEC79011.1 peptidase M23 [Flavobacterium aquatile]
MQKAVFTFFLVLLTSLSWSQQTQEELEQRKAKIQAEIREKEMMLQDVRKQEKSVSKLLTIQKEKIGLKQKLITTTAKQTKLLSNDIYINQVEINKLKKDLIVLKEDYAEMIVKSYKSRSTQSRAMFLLSSENFLQAYKRLQYMKQYSNYRKMQGEEIKAKTIRLDDNVKRLSGQKTEKEKLLADQEKQRQDLEKEKADQEKIAKSLNKSKKQITAEIKAKQQESKRIDAQIKKLIREAIAEANRKAAAERAKANPKTTTAAETKKIESSDKIILTPEGKIISDNFRANKGNLPWPVEKGAITLGYGDQAHPVYKSLVVHNSGVEITTENGSNARAVFGGEVTKVIKISPLNIAVFIRHGDYFTVYQNLSSVSVSVGDKVAIKQSLGKIRTNADGKTILKFMVSQNTTYNNPATWLN